MNLFLGVIMSNPYFISLDIGGTKINAGRWQNGVIESNAVVVFDALASENSIINFISEIIQSYLNAESSPVAICIGVPCIVDEAEGTLKDTVNVPAWQNYPLKEKLEDRFAVPVYINNDVNCYAFGEFLLSESCSKNFVGVCLGTGVGAGIVLNGELYSGLNCAAGEVGSIAYLESTFDNYCSGAFFHREFGANGKALAELAESGDEVALQAFEQFGEHIAALVTQIILMIDPEQIVFGGSVASSFHLFEKPMLKKLKLFPSQDVIKRLLISKSENTNSALIGAIKLFEEKHSKGVLV